MRSTHLEIQILSEPAEWIGGYLAYWPDSYDLLRSHWSAVDLARDETFVVTTRILQVPCPHPTCGADPLKWCRKPAGSLMNGLHMRRYDRSRLESVGAPGRVLIVPDGVL